MTGRSAGGLVLLLIGALALIGYLTGNLDRWLAALFVPPGATTSSSAGAVPTSALAGGAGVSPIPLATPPGHTQRQVTLA